MADALYLAAKTACTTDFDQIKTNYLASDKSTFDGEKGGIYFTTLSQECQDGITAMKTSLNALSTGIKNSQKSKIADLEDTIAYVENTKVLVTGWQRPATSTTITDADAKMGMCVYQSEASETASCWTYKNSASEFNGYGIKPKEWNAKSAQSRKLDVATFPGKRKDKSNSFKTWQRWMCTVIPEAEADGIEIKAGNVGTVCLKVIPNATKATAEDPAFVSGDVTVSTYDSEQTVE